MRTFAPFLWSAFPRDALLALFLVIFRCVVKVELVRRAFYGNLCCPVRVLTELFYYILHYEGGGGLKLIFKLKFDVLCFCVLPWGELWPGKTR